MEEILSVENIKKEYGRKGSKHEALRGITFKYYFYNRFTFIRRYLYKWKEYY